MTEKTFVTPCGSIHYWVNSICPHRQSLVFLPGLTADHRLFDKQIAHFHKQYNVLVWDAPGHAASWPWKSLLKWGVKGVAATQYGRNLMQDMMMVYDGDQARYAKLSGHGMKLLAQAMEADLPYKIPCPALLICGEKDQAGSCIRYARAWHKDTGIPLEWIQNAGHNSNTDQPEIVNGLIEKLAQMAKG